MQVSAITPQRRETGRWNIFIDGEYAFALPPEDIAYFKLKEGEAVSEETVAFIRKNLVYIKAQDTALHFIGYKMRTVKEVSRKLAEKEYADSVIGEVLVFLEKYGYTNDEEYARRYIAERLRLNPRGAFVLKMELRERGVSEEICEGVLQEMPPAEEADALGWLQKKSRGAWPPAEKKKKQMYGFLQRKGYSYDVIKEAFRQMDEEMAGR